MARNIKIILFGLMSGCVGLSIGYLGGLFIVEIGNYLDIKKWVLLTISIIFVGGGIFMFLLPLENKYIWGRLKGIDIKNIPESGQDNFLLSFAPLSFFLITGILLGIQLNY